MSLEEIAADAFKEAVTSGTSGAGQATYGGADDEEEEDEDVADKMADSAASIAKYRVYVDSPAEVPDEYEVQEGAQGGLYYEVEGGGDPGERVEPDEEAFEEMYNIGEYEVESEYSAAVAEAVTEGWFGNTHNEEDYVAVRSLQHNLAQVENADLLLDALEQEKEGRNSRACVDRLESRIRALGGDVPEPEGVDPGEVPEIRQGTSLDGMRSNDAIGAIGAVMSGRIDTSTSDFNMEEWNHLLDHMTQEELHEAAETFIFNSLKGDFPALQMQGEPKDVLSWEGEVDDLDVSERPGPPYRDNIVGVVSRLEPEYADEVMEKVEDVWSSDSRLSEEEAKRNRRSAYRSFGLMGRRPETRQKAIERFEENGGDLETYDVMIMQTTEDFDTFQKAFIGNWTGMGDSVSFARAGLTDLLSNEGSEGLSVYGRGYLEAPIELSEQTKEHFESLRDVSKEYHEKLAEQSEEAVYEAFNVEARHRDGAKDPLNDDGTITVYRGVSSEVTSHTPLESWSISEDVGEKFDGHGVMEARVNPEDILMSKALKQEGMKPAGYDHEYEVTVMGGALQ